MQCSAVINMGDSTSEIGDTYVLLLSFLHKEGFSIISQLHVEIHRLPVDLYVNLKEVQRIFFFKTALIWKM